MKKTGLAKLAISFALDYIAKSGGGIVEVFPFMINGSTHQCRFKGSVDYYASLGFERGIPVGKNEIIMRKEV